MTKKVKKTAAPATGMLPAGEAMSKMAGLGFEQIVHLPGTTYQDNSTVIVIPTRGTINHRVVTAWQGLIGPMNQKRTMIFATGDEVGKAYNNMIEFILGHPELSKWKYVMTLEDDNLPPPDAQIRLLESIEQTKVDAISGIYFTKGDIGMPMAYGDPDEFARTGVLDFRPRDVRAAVQRGMIMHVNGIAMGCALWRMDLFRQVPGPWFVTMADHIPGVGSKVYTQDLSFCEKAVRMGKRFAVDFRVKVGHLDINTGVVY